MITLLFFCLLAAPEPTLWVKRQGAKLLLNADLRPLFDPSLKRRLQSGLSITLDLRIKLQGFNSEVLYGLTWRTARVRWDLWEEQLSMDLHSPKGHSLKQLQDLSSFLKEFAQFEEVELAKKIPRNPKVYQIQIILDVNPLDLREQQRIRRWLASGDAASSLDPVSGSLLGSFARFFDNLKPGIAERSLHHQGQPFRGDRLPER